MNRCLIVGDVPAPVVRLAERNGKTIARVALGSNPEARGVYMIIHVPKAPTAEETEALEDWLARADDSNVRVGLTSDSGVTPDVLALLLLHHSPYALQLLNEGENGANERAVVEFLRQDVYREAPKDDDIRLGRYFDWNTDQVQYRRKRQLTLKSKTMEKFMSGLRDAVLAMASPLPDSVTARGPVPRWNPSGPLSPNLPKGGLGAHPSLRDLFFAHMTPQAQALLHPDRGSADWSAEKLLVQGESGSGKTLVFEMVRDLLQRAQGGTDLPSATVNCAALGANNLTHELFGAAPGVWSGIREPVVGSLAQAAYGIAFLDEVGDLDLSVQRGMLVFLQDGMIRPFGIEPFPGFVRIVAATNRDVPLLIERQQFRNDLSARFQFKIEIPPLRDREPEELERLIDFVALNPAHNRGFKVKAISRNALESLKRHQYRDENFRELERIVHASIAAARNRRSPCVRSKDVREATDLGAEPKVVRDSEAYIIDVAAPPSDRHGTMIDVAAARDIARAAAFSKAPILRAPDGSQYVLTREAVFRHQPGRPTEAA
ncbi:MAG: sigma 54-interacting transcriptional regulator [Bifidobacteriaceae bacterium]|jgi:hypothetical protein|nr:sigma 54-interacting transcriptional regulator [Bifidobacteriaceae bacterium]